MLVHGPWQGVVYSAGLATVVYFLIILGALTVAILGWPAMIGGLALLVAFVLLLRMIPLFLNLSRSYFTMLLGYLVCHVVGTILYYALQYRVSGLMDGTAKTRSLQDAVYFSVNKWATLGPSDLVLVDDMRSVVSLESLTGKITFAIAVALLWLWCSENLVPKERAFFGGDMRPKGSLAIHRMRVRKLTGAKRDLSAKWADPPAPGQSMYWDSVKASWEEVEDGIELPENTLIVERVIERGGGNPPSGPQSTSVDSTSPKQGETN